MVNNSRILFHLGFQLWDLTSGKLLHDFKQHTAAVNCVEFHPKEFLLATAGNDRFGTVLIVLLSVEVCESAVMCHHLTVIQRLLVSCDLVRVVH